MRELIEMITSGVEALAVVIIVGGIVYGITGYFFNRSVAPGGAYRGLKNKIGNSLLLGLEFLVAADIIRTVALNPTLTNVATLGVLVLIRTFLSWALLVEIEGRWPWQARAESKAME
jgi:uncharacterized membrane protein